MPLLPLLSLFLPLLLPPPFSLVSLSSSQVSLQRGYNVIMKDNAEPGLVRGYQQVHKGSVHNCIISAFIQCITAQRAHEPFSDTTLQTRYIHVQYTYHVLYHPVTPYTVHRLNDRVRKRAMTSFERDKTMSNMSSQLDYKVHPHTHTYTHICPSWSNPCTHCRVLRTQTW